MTTSLRSKLAGVSIVFATTVTGLGATTSAASATTITTTPSEQAATTTLIGCDSGRVCLYKHQMWRAPVISLAPGWYPDLRQLRFSDGSSVNDAVTAVQVGGGVPAWGVCLYEHPNYRGRSYFAQYDADFSYDWTRWFNDRASSLKFVPRFTTTSPC